MADNKVGLELENINSNYIVGIGASAGGLEAIHELFDNMPADTNFSFVVIQHLSPDYKSLMPELLAKHTSMKIIEAADGMKLLPNHIYLIPSKKLMSVTKDTIVLTEKVDNRAPNTAIDTFFTALAKEKGNKAIGIILSGTGTDGTRGIEAIKNNGGIVIVQDAVSARFDGMPNSAIATGYADLILPPELIPGELTEFIVEAPFLKAFNELNRKDETIVKEILEIVKMETGYDFSSYKRPTINRRLVKRMTQNNFINLVDYRNFLNKNNEEVKKLSKDFLIGVTKFFRDGEAFDTLRQQVMPAILNKQGGEGSVKIWVVACSTGEEAYSMAILVQDHLEKNEAADVTVKIFASDIDPAALEVASRGIYPKTIANDIPGEWLEKYFKPEGDYYRISPIIRKMVVFAPHDVLKDPPFCKVDLVSCRNMLIYMNAELQHKILKKFHFALNSGGFLMLGPSENISILKEQVTEVNKKWKIFKTVERAKLLDDGMLPMLMDNRYLGKTKSFKQKNALNFLPELFSETVTEAFNFAGILVDKDMEVKQATGNFKNFLSFPDTNFNFSLQKLVAPELALAITSAVRRATTDGEKVVVKNIKIRDQNNSLRVITIIVRPFLQQDEFVQPFIYIVLCEEEKQQKVKKDYPVEQGSNDLQERLHELEQELKETKENLQSVVEELETSNEELQSSNEEMISANEELQSTNEELQSLNEELHTVNTEHQLKIKELIELNDDLNNYFLNTNIGQLLVDKNLIIRRFSPSAKLLVNLRESDIGRKISDISYNVQDIDLIADIKQVISTDEQIEKEVTTGDGAIYRMLINPFLRQDSTSDGTVITFVDITELKQLNSLIQSVFNSSLNGIMAFKAIRNEENQIADLEWLAANKFSENFLDLPPGHLVGRSFRTQFPDESKDIFEKLVHVIHSGETLFMEHFYEKKERWLQLIGVKMDDGLVLTFIDITTQKQALELLAKGYEDLRLKSNQLKTSNNELERSNYDLMQFASVASHDLKEPLRKIQTYGNLLYSKINSQLQDNELGYLDKMIRSSQRMQTLIDDVLTFSKLSNTNLHFTQTDLNNVLSRILEDLEIIIKEKKVAFHIPKLPVIEAIPGQMHQLFQNLISNGLKFNNSEEPMLAIEECEISLDEANELGIQADDFVCISVKDNGIGFDEKYVDKIFKIFQRLHSHSEYQGTGIGLAICKKIIENHNGHIKVESKPGKGTSFHIILPKKQVMVSVELTKEEIMSN
ncbi:CheR family methyltransferase [Aridibaculum aurantiacum]|uniref:CheR family methyltransferase n=1 Tax=Aridibaculum aurantiacum TaxID=2810307 RepID=UPI001A95D8A8|nr:chemotaxis protein CheB [Aridibaculum aurantiacum]